MRSKQFGFWSEIDPKYKIRNDELLFRFMGTKMGIKRIAKYFGKKEHIVREVYFSLKKQRENKQSETINEQGVKVTVYKAAYALGTYPQLNFNSNER